MKVYEKIFTREFSVPWLQIWYQGEAKMPKPWNGKTNPSYPYIVFLRHDDTVTSFYDREGLDWSRDSVLSEIRNDSKFVLAIAGKVKPILDKVSFYTKSKSTPKLDTLVSFLDFFQKSYPWLLALWEVGESDPRKIEGLDVDMLLSIKESAVTLTDDIDNYILESLNRIYKETVGLNQVVTIDEIKSGKIPSMSVLKERDRGFLYTDGTFYIPINIKWFEQKFGLKLDLVDPKKKVDKFKGRSASPGQAKGKVRLIMSVKHMDNFEEGEILVSPMTMPDFVPAMAKSAAIVTDEGGITCHAAIIARELGKPCIVGTKIASEVLKNGDVVAVDADVGVVKII